MNASRHMEKQNWAWSCPVLRQSIANYRFRAGPSQLQNALLHSIILYIFLYKRSAMSN